MCGRFVMDYKTDKLIQDLIDQGFSVGEAFLEIMGNVPPTYSIAPTNQVPVVAGQSIDLAQWGFLRTFSGRKQNLINTRIEKLTTARTWKKPFLTSRIVVPMSGYYEWIDRKPWYVTGDQALFASGLIEHKDDGAYFTIITCESKDEAGKVHDRMPAFLSEDLLDDWLGDDLESSDAQTMAEQLNDSANRVAASLKTWEVSQRINSVRVDRTDASLIEKVN